MTPEHFISKWKAADLKERAAAQSHFNDLCELLGEEKPTDADPKGEWYCFERGATKTTGGEGWADVWRRGCFGWEYKSRGKSLDDAIDQLKRYALALEPAAPDRLQSRPLPHRHQLDQRCLGAPRVRPRRPA